MSENKMSDIIKASMDGIKSFTDMETVIDFNSDIDSELRG